MWLGRAVDIATGCWLAVRKGCFAGGREPLVERGGAAGWRIGGGGLRHDAKAVEDRRTPKRWRVIERPAYAIASWSAPVLWRFVPAV